MKDNVWTHIWVFIICHTVILFLCAYTLTYSIHITGITSGVYGIYITCIILLFSRISFTLTWTTSGLTFDPSQKRRKQTAWQWTVFTLHLKISSNQANEITFLINLIHNQAITVHHRNTILLASCFNSVIYSSALNVAFIVQVFPTASQDSRMGHWKFLFWVITVLSFQTTSMLVMFME